ncbi:hypothetical protein AB0G32_38435 [Streptomyces sp. NPDC023723]|uniref:hypothetical protein n=1 Tax=Streptomyces sp. NPDC023723 TaxID=3154323 RepID=UPI00340BA335
MSLLEAVPSGAGGQDDDLLGDGPHRQPDAEPHLDRALGHPGLRRHIRYGARPDSAVYARDLGCDVVEVGLAAEEERTSLVNGTAAAPLFLSHHVLGTTVPGGPVRRSPGLGGRVRPGEPFVSTVDDVYEGFVFSRADSGV